MFPETLAHTGQRHDQGTASSQRSQRGACSEVGSGRLRPGHVAVGGVGDWGMRFSKMAPATGCVVGSREVRSGEGTPTVVKVDMRGPTAAQGSLPGGVDGAGT